MMILWIFFAKLVHVLPVRQRSERSRDDGSYGVEILLCGVADNKGRLELGAGMGAEDVLLVVGGRG